MVDIWNCLRRVWTGLENFENFLYSVGIILFSLLLLRVIVAVFMGRWTLM